MQGSYYWLGKNYNAIGDSDNAFINFQKAIELNNPTASDIGADYVELAKIYFFNSEYDKAGKTLRKLNEIDASVCLKPENLDQCIIMYDYANMPKDAENLYQRSSSKSSMMYLLIREHEYDAAIKLAASIIEQFPNNEMSYYMIGVASGAKGENAKAIDAIKKATAFQGQEQGVAITIADNNGPILNLSPKKYLPMYTSLAYFLTQNGDYDAAMSAYNDAIAKTKIQSVMNAANTYNRWVEATQSYQTGYFSSTETVSYNDYNSLMALTLIYYNAGKYNEALKTVNDYIKKVNANNLGIYTSSNCMFIYSHYVVSVKPGSPAEKADLQFGDKIIKINGKSITNKMREDVLKGLSVPVGEKVTLMIERYTDPVKRKGKIILEKTLISETPKDKFAVSRLAAAYGIRSLIYRAQGSSDMAYKDAQTAINYNPQDFNAKLAWGFANIDKKNYDVALKILASTKLPANERLYQFETKFMRRISISYSFIPFPTDNELPKLAKALAYLKLGKFDDAIDYLPSKEIPAYAGALGKEYQALAVELNKVSEKHNEKGASLYKNGFLKEALNEYKIALTYTNNKAKEDEIIKNIVNLLQEYPVNSTMSEETRKYSIRIGMLVSQGNYSAALDEAKKMIKSDPTILGGYYNFAMANSCLKNYDIAIEYMNFYIKLAPNATDIQEAKDNVTKWELLQEGKI